jgi:hypothetical protein
MRLNQLFCLTDSQFVIKGAITEGLDMDDTDPQLRQWLLKLHKGATAAFNTKATQAVLNLFPGWTMTPGVFIKPSDQTGHGRDGFSSLTAATLERYSHWSKQIEPYKASIIPFSGKDPANPTRLVVDSHDEEEAKALHANVAKYQVAELPDPKKAKPDDYFVMHLTQPEPQKDKDGETEWVWSFDLYRKCKGYHITAPDGQSFDVCGPTQVLGYGGTKDFDAFFKWALANTDLEAEVNARLGLTKHLKAAERPRIPVGGQTIGTCAICMRQQVVRGGRMVLHGYQRPGHGYVIGNCFGVDHQPYETSAEACEAYIPVLKHHREQYQQRLADLNAGKINEFRQTKRNYRTGRDETVLIQKGDPDFDQVLKAHIKQCGEQIGYINLDLQTMQERIDNWKPGTLRRVEGLPGVAGG